MTACVVCWPGPEPDLEAPSLRVAAREIVRRWRREPGAPEIRIHSVETAAFPGAQPISVRLTTDPRRSGRLLAYVIADFPAGDFPPDMTARLRAAVTEQVDLDALKALPTNAVRHIQETAVA